jgi:hypothetical protein
MLLKILHFLQWFENVRSCREAALHLFVKQIPPTDSWHQVDSDRYNFHPLMPALTIVSLLERYLVLETAMPHGDNRLPIYNLCTKRGRECVLLGQNFCTLCFTNSELPTVSPKKYMLTI